MTRTKSTSVSSGPRVIVCAGGGGVGKTSSSAALSLSLARRGHRTLIVTIDPARRLAGALGVTITDEVSKVTLPVAGGNLSALMPDPRRSMRTFIELLFEGEPEAKERVLANTIYRGFADAAAGVHELVAMTLVAHACAGGAFEYVVIDTAPSRHAIDFVTYPGRLANLLGGKAVAWLSSLAQRGEAKPGAAGASSSGLLSWGSSHIEGLVARVTGPVLARDTAALFTELSRVRERFVALTKLASELLLGERATYALVCAPTAAAHDDVLYLAKRLEKLGRTPHALLLNRADTKPAPYVTALREARGVSPAIVEAAQTLEQERKSRSDAADAMARDFAKALRGVRQLRLSFVEASAPDAVVLALSEELDAQLDAFV